MRPLLRAVRRRLEYGLILCARACDRLLGPDRSAALAAALGRFTYRRLRIRADVVEDQLRRAFPDRDEAWVRKTALAAYAHLAREAMALLRLSRLGQDAVIEATEIVEGFDELRAALAGGAGGDAGADEGSGRGAVIVTGHFGNWEIGGAALAARGVPLDAVARSQENPLVDRMVNAGRERLGMTVVPMAAATRGSLAALRAGRAVGLVADQDARDSGVFVPFFGRPASTFRGPATLALRTGATVFLATAVRRPDGRYAVRLRRIPVPGGAAGESRERALTASLMAALESAVREHPEQYLWHHRRWKTRPPEEEVAGNGGGGDVV